MLRDCPKCGLPSEFVITVDGAWLQKRWGLGYPGVEYVLFRCVDLHLTAEAPTSV